MKPPSAAVRILKKINLGKSVTYVGDWAFDDCYELDNVKFPESIQYIGESAFSNCQKLSSITIPDADVLIQSTSFHDTEYYNNSSNWVHDVLYINNHLVNAKNVIGGYSISKDTLTIASRAFSDCTGLASITFPESLRIINYEAFKNCTSLTNIFIPGNIIKIGTLAFYDCSTINNIVIADGAKGIHSSAFHNTAYYDNFRNWSHDYTTLYIGKHLIASECGGGKNINIHEGTLTIADEAFTHFEFRELDEITIPASVEYIGENAFVYYLLSNITVDENNKYYSSEGGVLFNKSKTTLIRYPANHYKADYVVPDSVKIIADYAFANSKNLLGVTIPEGVTYIGKNAFVLCKALKKELVIPDSVTFMGDEAFTATFALEGVKIGNGLATIPYRAFNNSAIKHMTLTNSTTRIADNAFYGCDNLTDIKYSGSERQWNKLRIGNKNSCLEKATISFDASYDKGEPEEKDEVYEEPTTKPTVVPTTKPTVIPTVPVVPTTKPESTTNKENSNKTKPSKVKGLKVKKATVSSLTVSWNKVKSAEKYKVYYSKNGSKWKAKTTTKTTCTLTKLPSGQSYQIKVKAIAGKTEGKASRTVKTATVVEQVSLKSAKSTKKAAAVIKWESVSGASGYVIEYSTSKKFKSKKTKEITKKSLKASTLKKLKRGKVYYVRVKAYKTVNGKNVYGKTSKVLSVKVK